MRTHRRAGWRRWLFWKAQPASLHLAGRSEHQRGPPAESAARISGELLRRAPDADVTVRILPNADYTFRLPPGPSGWPNTAPDYLTTLVNWVSARC